ncbi:Protein-lysine N-methyltransferase efm6 [Saxophila tyrrhenica]|uniref:Protein-lysine N-methyltransferase EFM6 n=1 Tax=Saxophila tyrrhenica TaxID=1690608 RepID=A0AAV9PD78_9PEZI|nr:Protein-lysine N-methyltransferase efm6 [Saxophila tyrrhenica]
MADRDSEPSDVLTMIGEDLVQSREHKAPQTSRIDFDGLLQPELVLHQDLAKGNGGQAWPAGMVLAKYLLRRKRDELRESTILELGAGSGLVGLAITVGCQPTTPVCITDQKPMLALMQQNTALNNLQDKVVPAVYNWGADSLVPVAEHPDVVLAADCVYFEPAFPLLLESLEALIGPNTVCYFCYKKRRRADQRFITALNKRFLVEPALDDPDRAAYTRQNIFLYTIRRKEKR